MMRRLKLIVVSMSIILVLSASTAFAVNVSVPDADIMADNYLAATATISFSGSTAEPAGTITGKVGKTTKTSIHLYLQQYKNGSWVSIDDWTSSGNTVTRSLSKTKTVTKGYKYRAKAVCAAYVGNDKETVTKYSSAVRY